MEWLNEYSVPVVVGICLCVGYVIKHSLSFINNKYIPLIMAVLGLTINILINLPGVTAEVILGGLFSGLASTGVHNLVTEMGILPAEKNKID